MRLSKGGLVSKKVLTKASDKLQVLAFSAYADGNTARAEALYEAYLIVKLDEKKGASWKIKMR